MLLTKLIKNKTGLNKIRSLFINKIDVRTENYEEDEIRLDTAHFPCRMDEMYDEAFNDDASNCKY